MDESPENPLNITSEMMSQTTSALLANMAMDVSLNASGASRDKPATSEGQSRRPLHAIHNDGEILSEGNITRVMGPKETHYRAKCDDFVTKTIRSYAARGGAKLPKYRQMNEEQRKSAMSEVDALLERLNCGSVVSHATAANVNETFGSVTTVGDNNETCGSATTLDEGHSEILLNNTTVNQSTCSATTMGEGRKSLATNQSMSLLEESMVLLSDDEAADGESHFSKSQSPIISPIERTRHASKPRESMLDTDLSSPLFDYRSTSKRCASNSGKRGFKSRVRLDESDDAESSLLKHFEDNENLFCEEDAFSCGSPIQRRFSCDLEDRDGVEEFKKEEVNKSAEDDEELSRFSLQEEVNFNNDDDYDNFEEDDTSEQHPAYQQSQWSTFQNANPKSTYPDDDEEEDESPVRRRAIKFGDNSQRPATLRKPKSTTLNEANDSEGEISQQMSEMVVEDNNSNDSGDDDPIQTVRNLSRRAKALESQGVDSSLLDEVAPTDIRLRDGAHFRMDPLRCRQTKDKSKSVRKQPKSVKIVHPKAKSKLAAVKKYESDSENSLSDPEPSFNDPVSRFPTRVATRLNGAFDFIMNKERDTSPDFQNDALSESCGVLLSMPIDQCVSIASKLLIHTIKSGRLHQKSMNGLSKKSKRHTPTVQLSQEKSVLAGGTLILLRDKADISQWEVALREYTSLSVMNHAEMQSSLRKLANTAAKCAGFDVVLSTYDAIKAKEVTVPVDETGRAMLDNNADPSETDDGWLTSRVAGSAQAPRKCHQLSVLHRMVWHRLIMIDVLGRKGFLIKPGTARAQAAVAINSVSRFILFEKETEDTGKPTEKFKDDRRQLRSVANALQLPSSLKLDKFINHFVLDVSKVGRCNETRCHSESSSESELDEYDVSQEEDSISYDENLTEP